MKRSAFLYIAAAFLFLSFVSSSRAGTLAGRLLDSAGKPVSGAKVVWIPYRSEEETLLDLTRGTEPSPADETATDSEGRFRVLLDKPGSLVSVRILAAGLPSVFLAGPYEASDEVLLEEIQFPAGEKISGKVTEEGGKPVAGAKVRVTGGLGLSEEEVSFYSETSTGTDGSFSLGAAPENARSLTVRAPGFSPYSRFRLEGPLSEKITLKRGGSIRGTVLDPSGKPASGAIVTSGELAFETDASGNYRLAGIPPGSRSVEALWKEDFAARKDAARVRKGEEVEVPLRLAQAAAISGTVMEEKTRKPLAGVSVQASTTPFSLRFRGEGIARRARTDARGRFRIPGLSPRRYTVQASKKGFLPASIAGIVAGTQSPGSVSLALARAAGISGRVTAEDGKPVAGARVRFAREDSMRALMRSASPMALLSPQSALSKTDGSFRLRNLAPARNLTLEASKTGYAAARRHGVSLKAGEQVKDFALVLPRGLEARGRVVDGQEQPVAGAEIRVSPAEGGVGEGIRIVTRMMSREKPDAVSSANGSFVVSGLDEGEYVASVSREGYARKGFSALEVKAKPPNEWPPFVLSAGLSVAGFVRNAKGEAIIAASVSTFNEQGDIRDTTSDSEGRFRLEDFSAERSVMLNVIAEGYAPLRRGVTPPAADLTLVLTASGILQGRVEDAETKRPLTDFTVGYSAPRTAGFVIRMGGGLGDRSFQSADGSFELPDVPAGKWAVRASAPGYRTAEVAGVEVAEGETKEGIVLSLKKGGVLSGRVLDARRNTGVPNASVSWQPVRSEATGRLPAAMMSRLTGAEYGTTTDADGRFRFDGLPEGKVAVTASHPDFLEAAKDVEGDAETSVDLMLSTGGAISGTVVGKDGRIPAAGAQVSLNELGDSPRGWGGDSTRANGAGNFLFEHLKAGRFRVSAEANAGKAAPKEVVLAESQRLDGLLLQMASGATLRGTVTGLPPGRLGGVRVSASAKDYNDMTQTDEAGRFTLRDVPAGALRLNATTALISGRSTAKSVEIPEGAVEFPVELLFEGSSRLSGRITRGEKTLTGLFVNANPDPPSATGTRSSAQTEEGGRYVLEGLTDGNYQVFVSGPGVSYRKVVAVSGDTQADIALPAVSLSGFVTDVGTGEPLEGANVQAETGRETVAFTMRQAVTDSRGFYTLDDLDSGNYKVTARKERYQMKEQTVAVGASSSELNVALARGAGVQIRAADGLTGLPLKGVSVTAFSAGGSVAFNGSLSLDSEGRGEISSLAPGNYSLYFFSQGYAPRSFPSVSVPAAPLTIGMTPGGRVEVRTDSPVTARILDASGSLYVLSPWRLDGRVNPAPPLTSWDNFAPGTYQLIVTSASGEKTYPFTVAEGQLTTVEVK